MALAQPYKRIARPFDSSSGGWSGNGPLDESYLVDPDYAPDRASLIRAYHSLETDLIKIFDFIEPHDNNLETYSTRLYEILLRAPTEFESNCKLILRSNGYSRPISGLNMNDYKKIDLATRLSEYELRIHMWSGGAKSISPLIGWTGGGSLQWYQAYNTVKHNRSNEFHLANFNNSILSVASVFSILFSQFYVLVFSNTGLISWYEESDGWISHDKSIFSVRPPDTWTPSELYNFKNDELTTMSTKFDQFSF